MSLLLRLAAGVEPSIPAEVVPSKATIVSLVERPATGHALGNVLDLLVILAFRFLLHLSGQPVEHLDQVADDRHVQHGPALREDAARGLEEGH